MKHLEGLVAVVTGSGQGVGRGIAIGLAREGARLVINDLRPAEAAVYDPDSMPEEEWKKAMSMRGDGEATAALIRVEGGEAAVCCADVSRFEECRKLIDFAVETYGRIDILVNNAAGLRQGSLVQTSEEDWDYVTGAKIRGTFATMHYAVPYMVRQGFGRILNVASDAWTGLPDLSAYSAGNAASIGLSWAAAKELSGKGITVNVLCPQANSPGHVVQFNQTVRELESRFGSSAIDTDRMKAAEAEHGPAENLAPLLAYLCTPAAASVNGVVFRASGAGMIGAYRNPQVQGEARKQGAPWTVEELETVVPQQLLSEQA